MAELDLDDLLASAREVDQPTSEHAGQLFEGVLSGAASAGAASAGVNLAASKIVAGKVAASSAFGSGTIVGVGALVGLGGAALLLIDSTEAPVVPPPAVPAPAVPSLPTKADAPPTNKTAPPRVDRIETPDANSAPKKLLSEKHTPPPRSPEDRLAEEVALLRRAKLAFNGKNYQEALKLLDRYRSKFPQGTLKGEAQATRVLVLCALKQSDEARRQAGHLDENSLLGEKMKTGCKAR